MTWVASAPGKLVLLGEYAVLDGASALVMAVDRRCLARIGPARGALCRLSCRMPEPVLSTFEISAPSGSDLVEAIRNAPDLPGPAGAWEATIDSAAFFAGRRKLGLGSSAAALVAFAGAWCAAAGAAGQPSLDQLIDAHRSFQGGSGSGIDVAAALAGGVQSFRLDAARRAQIGSVRLPKSVGFASVFAGGSASTPDLVGRYRRFVDTGSSAAEGLRDRMSAIASAGLAAVEDQHGSAFVAAMDAYGRCIADLGNAIGADLVTARHREAGDLAERLGLAYKVSGAGGGDVGIACGLDRDALQEFSAGAAERGFEVVELAVDDHGLRVEEHAE